MDGSSVERVYTNQWFRDSVQPYWERELLPVKAEIAHYLEVGVCEGQSMLWVLEHLIEDKPDGFALGLDPYPVRRPLIFESAEITKANAIHNLQPYLIAGRARLLQAATWQVFRGGRHDLGRIASDRFYDLLYIDGSHLAWDTLNDIVLTYPLLKKGGLLIIDDYSLQDWNGRPMTYFAAQAVEQCLGARLERLFHIPDGRHLPKQVCYRKRK